jgi:ectoine hydroxylase-related dioxygenase (phytanoyl-CoA dioxygenase family)
MPTVTPDSPTASSAASSVRRRLLRAPLWVLQVLHLSKSFEDNPLLGSRLLNRLGLHVVRVVLAHLVTRWRAWLLSPWASAGDRGAFRQQGYLVVPDVLPANAFDTLAAEVRAFDGAEARECVQGDTVNRRTPLDPAAREALPGCRALLEDREVRGLLQWAATTLRPPLAFVEQVFHARQQDDRPDPQKHLHADTFHPTMKAWLFLEPVPLEKGPFCFIPGSHRLTWARLRWEYRRSLGWRQADRYSRRGSPRLTEADRQSLGLPEPLPMVIPANTLVIANTFGFHARGRAPAGSARLALYFDSRTNPFNPLPGFGGGWVDALQYRVLQRRRERQDRAAARHGGRSSWHRVHGDLAKH